jgi:glycosyltransferase involved in cell wall biosynthesis
MRRRILYVIGTLGRGGAERQLFYLLSRMDRERCQPAVITLDGAEQDAYVPVLRSLGVPVFAGPSGSGRPAKLRSLVRLARRLRPELIHSYSFYCNALAAAAAFAVGERAIGSLRSDFDRQRRRSPYLWRLNAAFPRRQIWNSQGAVDQARAFWRGSVRPEIVVVRPGLDLDDWPATPLPAGETPVIVAVGSLLPVKRWDRLLSAAAVLAGKGIPFRVCLAGEGPLRPRLEEQARELNLLRHMEFLGDVSNVAALFSDAALLVHPSESEGGPNVVMEAMASARAVVATDTGDVRHMVRHGISGVVIPNVDGPELAEALALLLSRPERLAEMGRAARRDAEAKFGVDRMVEETFDVYRRAGWMP